MNASQRQAKTIKHRMAGKSRTCIFPKPTRTSHLQAGYGLRGFFEKKRQDLKKSRIPVQEGAGFYRMASSCRNTGWIFQGLTISGKETKYLSGKPVSC
jgi:hypothetical protein